MRQILAEKVPATNFLTIYPRAALGLPTWRSDRQVLLGFCIFDNIDKVFKSLLDNIFWGWYDTNSPQSGPLATGEDEFFSFRMEVMQYARLPLLVSLQQVRFERHDRHDQGLGRRPRALLGGRVLWPAPEPRGLTRASQPRPQSAAGGAHPLATLF